MKRYWYVFPALVVFVVVAALAATGAGPARADLGTAHDPPTCGINDSSSDAVASLLTHIGPPTQWDIQVDYRCGPGKTFMAEIQSCLSNCGAGANYSGFADASNHHWVTSNGCGGGTCEINILDSSFSCGILTLYRVQVFDANGRKHTYPTQAGDQVNC